jgi:hypothetical protein
MILKVYKYYMEKYDDILNEIEFMCRKNKRFEILYRDFETQKICYLPFTLFLLKPIQRMLYYKTILESKADEMGLFIGIPFPIGHSQCRALDCVWTQARQLPGHLQCFHENRGRLPDNTRKYPFIRKLNIHEIFARLDSDILAFRKENKQKLIELQRELIGTDSLAPIASKYKKV